MTAANSSAMRSFSTGRESRVLHHAAISAAGARHKKGGVTQDCQVWEKRAMRGSALEPGMALVRLTVRDHHRAMMLPRATAASGKLGVAVRSKGGCNRRVAE